MSQAYEIIGTIKLIGETQSFASGFTKRTFVITTDDDKYPQDIPLDAVKDGCTRLDAYKVGDEITVSFNIRGNEYNGKYYCSLQAWKFDRGAGEKQEPREQNKSAGQERRSSNQNGARPPADDFDVEDDIPF